MPISVRSALIEKLSPTVRHGLSKAHLQPQAAEDAYQQTILKILPHLERLAAMPEDERKAYAYVTAMREGLVARKSGRREVPLSPVENGTDRAEARIAIRQPSPETLVGCARSAQRAKIAMNGLMTQDRQVLNAASDGASGDEIAAQLGVSRRTVVDRLQLARKAVRRAWDGRTSWFQAADKKK